MTQADTSLSNAFFADIAIDTDDDFHVCIEGKVIHCYGSVRVFGPTASAARDAALAAIEKATLPWAKKWAIEDSQGRREGSYARQWEDVKGYLRTAVAEDPDAFSWSVGGNQTISVDMGHAAAVALATAKAERELALGTAPETELEMVPFGWYWEAHREDDGSLVDTGFSRESPPPLPSQAGVTHTVTELYRKR